MMKLKILKNCYFFYYQNETWKFVTLYMYKIYKLSNANLLQFYNNFNFLSFLMRLACVGYTELTTLR